MTKSAKCLHCIENTDGDNQYHQDNEELVSTAWLSIFLFRARPAMPPPIPPATINARAIGGKPGTPEISAASKLAS